jgi:hypothetical protein
MVDWCKKVYEIARNNPKGVPSAFAQWGHNVNDAVLRFDGLKTSLYCDFSTEALDRLRLSLVLSDLTSLFPQGGREMTIATVTPESAGFPEYISLPVPEAEKFVDGKSEPVLQCGYACRSDDGLGDSLDCLMPLVFSGRLLIRPRQIVMGIENHRNEMGSRSWRSFDLNPDSPTEVLLNNGKIGPQKSIPLETTPPTATEILAATVVMPYIKEIPFDDLAKVLDDEQDKIAAFRSSIKQLLREAQSRGARVTEVLNDVVRPATEKLQRSFDIIVKTHRIKMTGAIGATIAAGLFTTSTSGVAAGIAAMLGTGHLVVKERASQERELGKLADDPYYLLWKLGSLRNASEARS